MRRPLGWLCRGAAVLLMGMLGMLIAHCGGYQIAAASGLEGARTQSAPRLDHVGHHGAVHDHVASTDQVMPTTADIHAGHGHVVPLASGAFLLLLVVMLAAAVMAGRHVRFRAPSASVLLVTQIGLFVAMELGEGWAGGTSPITLLGQPRALVAFLLQVPVAMLIARLGRRVATLIAAILGQRAVPSLRPPREVALFALDASWPPTRYGGFIAAPRGPPAKRFIAI